MAYPEKHQCHQQDRVFAQREIVWETRPLEGSYGTGYRQCSYCGSLHPEDLLKILQIPGTRVNWADQKYGYLHKCYIEGVPNPRAGEIVQMGSRWDGEKDEPIMSPAPKTLSNKFYTEHLIDLVGQPELQEVSEIIRKRSGVEFFEQDGKLMHRWNPWPSPYGCKYYVDTSCIHGEVIAQALRGGQWNSGGYANCLLDNGQECPHRTQQNAAG